MFKIFVFACVVAYASAGNLVLSSPYAVAPLSYAAQPLAYSSYHQIPLAYTARYAAAPLAYSKIDGPSAFSSYSSVHTPDSYQQQYQSQVKPYSTYSHEYLY